MRSVHVNNPGLQNSLQILEQPIPKALATELLVQVEAAGVNHADLLQRLGKYPPPPNASNILGLEIAGKVVEIGKQVSTFKPGDSVYGLVSGGGYAEYCCVDQGLAQKIPSNWSYEQAAAIPEALVTAHATIFILGQLSKNQTLLIHGAGSGISSLAIQMAKQIGAKVITSIGNPSKLVQAKAMGANVILDHRQNDFFSRIGEKQINLIVDFIGGEYFPKHLRALKEKGCLIQMACMTGYRTECNLLEIIQKQLSILGFVLRSQSIQDKSTLWRLAHEMWLPFLVDDSISPVVDTVYSLKEVEKAHNRMQNSSHFGKIILCIN